MAFILRMTADVHGIHTHAGMTLTFAAEVRPAILMPPSSPAWPILLTPVSLNLHFPKGRLVLCGSCFCLVSLSGYEMRTLVGGMSSIPYGTGISLYAFI